jgi:hypothetical protein
MGGITVVKSICNQQYSVERYTTENSSVKEKWTKKSGIHNTGIVYHRYKTHTLRTTGLKCCKEN